MGWIVHHSKIGCRSAAMGQNPRLPQRTIVGCFTSGSSHNQDKAVCQQETHALQQIASLAYSEIAARPADAATSREGHRSLTVGPEVRHLRWGRERTQ